MLKEILLYNGKVKIFFDLGTPEKPKHIYKDEKGNVILSVTGATGIIDKSAALMGWVAKMMGLYLIDKFESGVIINRGTIETAKKEYRRIAGEAADIGTEIHEWVSDWILGKKPEMPENEKVVNGITAFLKFQKQHKFKWLESERLVYSKKHNYAGTLDAIAKEGNNLVLVDFKSSKAIYDDMRFQVAGYQIAYEEETGKKIDKRMIIRFGKEDGEFEVRELNEDAADKKVFLSCLNVKKRVKELLKKNGYRN